MTLLDKTYTHIEQQCPICNRWFNSYYNGYNTVGVKLHISKQANKEVLLKELGEIEKAPHFDFFKKYTIPREEKIIIKRDWKI